MSALNGAIVGMVAPKNSLSGKRNSKIELASNAPIHWAIIYLGT